MHKYVQNEVSYDYVGSIPNQTKYQNGCNLTNFGQNDQMFAVHILEASVHICTKYEVSTVNPVAMRGVHIRQRRMTDKA